MPQTPLNADNNTLTGMQTATPGLQNAKYDATTLLEYIKLELERLPFSTFAEKTPFKRNRGTRNVQFRGYKKLPIQSNLSLLTEGQDPAGMKMGARTVTGTVNDYGAWVGLTKQLDTYNLDLVKKEYLPLLAEHAAATLEMVIREEAHVGSSDFFVTTAATPTVDTIAAIDVLSIDVCRQIANQILANLRPGHRKFGSKQFAVLTTQEGMQDILDDPDLTDKILMTGQTNKPFLKNGMQEYPIFNLHFVEYTVLDADREIIKNALATEVHRTYVIGGGALATMELSGKTVSYPTVAFDASHSDHLGMSGSIGWSIMGFGAKVLDPLAITEISHAVGNPLSRAEDYYATQ